MRGMPAPLRPMPAVGMAVRVLHLGAVEHGVIEALLDEGRTLVVDGERFTLRRLNGRFVREGEPSFGARLAFGEGPGDQP